jgi:DNA polymerase family A
MKLTPVYVDMESFWSVTHTLSKMTNIEYVMHPETEIISMCMKVGSQGAAMVYFGEAEITKALSMVDWSRSMVIGHNMSGFDALILKWRFDINPKMWGCTLAMARSRYNADVGGSLGKLVAHFSDELKAMGISGVKDQSALINTKGRHLKDFTREEINAMAKYNKDDTEQCAGLFKILARDFPSKELLQIDLTTRMLVDPMFEVDQKLLTKTLTAVQEEKLRSLKELTAMLSTAEERVAHVLETGEQMEAFTKTQLMSSAKFSELLQRRGVDVPMKPSPSNPGKLIPALSKTDEEFLALQEHDDPIVAAAATARLEAKSTLLETRIGKFLSAAKDCYGFIPMPLRYAGAATTGRWSGEIFNPQNLPRIDPTKPRLSDALRNSLRAPKGFTVVTSDLSGIELRINHFLWQVKASMKLFHADPAKADLYKDFASRLYQVDAREVNKNQRQIGKIAHLGLGFGAGPGTFQRIAKTMGGVDMPAFEAQLVVQKWREEYDEIYQGWRTCHNGLKDIYNGNEAALDPWGLCKTGKDHIALPSGRKIWYPGLHQEKGNDGKSEWWYGVGRNRARIYAGKVDENIVQALAADVLRDVVRAMWLRHGIRPALLVHDEYVCVVRTETADFVQAILDGIMREPTAWWPGLIKWSESGMGDTYGSAH